MNFWNYTKKLILGCLGLAFLSSNIILAQDWWVEDPFKDNPFITEWDAWWAELVNLIWTAEWAWDSLANVIKWFINRILWILWLIALLIVLRWGFQMLTAAGNEERYNKWWTILKQAAIWLVVIWLAWFIVSLIFRVINLTTTNAGESWSTAG